MRTSGMLSGEQRTQPSDEPEEIDPNDEPCSTPKPSSDAQTQRSDPGMEDQTCSEGLTITCGMSPPSSAVSHPVTDSV